MNLTEESIDWQTPSARGTDSVREGRDYSAYGLRIRSELPLPEFTCLPADNTNPDVRVLYGSGYAWIPQVRDQESSWHVDQREARFWFRGVGGFRVYRGREIILTPEPSADEELLRLYVEGMMMATILYQRAFFVLHASVVQIRGSSVAIMGHAGAGKSSTAAALHMRGHGIVTDDNAAINLYSARPEVTPAFPYVKIFPAIADSLGYSAGSLRPMHQSQPKYVSGVAVGFPSAPVPLSCIYVLTREAAEPITPLNPAEAVIELIRNSVPARWKLHGGARHLKQCVELAGRLPAWRVRTFDTLPQLRQLAELIERHHIDSTNTDHAGETSA